MHPGNRRPSICCIFARNLHSIAHPRRCTSHSMRRADPAKGSVRKCDRSKVAGCLGYELGLKELKSRQLYKRLLRQSITGRCVLWCENESDAVVSCQAVTIGCDVRGVASLVWGWVRGTVGDCRSVIDHTAQPLPTPPISPPRTCPSSMLNYTVQTAGFCPVSGTFCINRGNRPIVWHRLSASALSVHP